MLSRAHALLALRGRALVLFCLATLLVSGCAGPPTPTVDDDGSGRPGEQRSDEPDAFPRLFMGQAPRERVELRFAPAQDLPRDRRLGAAVGRNHLVVHGAADTAGTREFIFYRREDLAEVARMREASVGRPGYGWAEFFWDDLYVLVTDRGTRVYAVENARVSMVWERPVAARLVGEGARRHLAVSAPALQLFRQREGTLSLAWEPDEPWEVTDLLAYGPDAMLVATADRGWLRVDLGDYSVVALGVGGPHEARAWEELGRRDGPPPRHRFLGATAEGTVLATVDGPLGSYYQFWASTPDGFRLVAENYLVWGEVSFWADARDETVGEGFEFQRGTSRLLNWRAYEIYGARYAVLEMDEAAVRRAVEAGREGPAARLRWEEGPGPHGRGVAAAPLGGFLSVRKPIGYRFFARTAGTRPWVAGDFSGAGKLELLAQRADGVHLITGNEREVRDVRLTGRRVQLGAVDESHGHVYLLTQDELFRFDLRTLLAPEHRTVYPSVKASWVLGADDTIRGLAAAGGRLYLQAGHGAGYVQAVDAGGRPLWRFEVDGTGPGVTADGETVYVPDSAGRVHALEAASGLPRWQVETRGWINSIVAGHGGVYVVGHTAGPRQGFLLALDNASGAERWRLDVAWARGVELIEDLVYLGAGGGYLYGLDPLTGAEIRRFHTGLGPAVLPVVAEGILLAVGWDETDHTYLQAVDFDTGASLWRLDLGYKAHVHQPAAGDGAVYLAVDGRLHAFDLETGSYRWSLDAEYGFASVALYAEQTVYVAGDHGYLYALAPDTGEIRWKYNGGARSPSFPWGIPLLLVRVDDTLYFAADNRLHAIDLVSRQDRH